MMDPGVAARVEALVAAKPLKPPVEVPRGGRTVRGGLVAAGIVLVFLGIAWFLPLMFGGAMGGLGGALGALCLWIIMAPIFIIIGLLLFVAGLVAKSDAEVAAMRQPVFFPYPPPYYAQPQAPVVVLQQPAQLESRTPPPPSS